MGTKVFKRMYTVKMQLLALFFISILHKNILATEIDFFRSKDRYSWVEYQKRASCDCFYPSPSSPQREYYRLFHNVVFCTNFDEKSLWYKYYLISSEIQNARIKSPLYFHEYFYNYNLHNISVKLYLNYLY